MTQETEAMPGAHRGSAADAGALLSRRNEPRASTMLPGVLDPGSGHPLVGVDGGGRGGRFPPYCAGHGA